MKDLDQPLGGIFGGGGSGGNNGGPVKSDFGVKGGMDGIKRK